MDHEFDTVVRKAIHEDLAGNEVLELFPNQLNFLLYERLYNYDNLSDIFDGKEGVVILYQYTKYNGHYVILLRRSSEIEYFDSLGYQVDSELKFLPYNKEPILSTLIRRYQGKVVINNYKFQRDSEGVSTCGRWCIVRFAFREFSLSQFTTFIKSSNMKYDTLVTIMSLIIKH